MELKAGITGFRDAKHHDLSRVDPRAFQRLVYDLARIIGGKVHRIEVDDSVRNFYWAELGEQEGTYLLCNAQYPIVAWSTNLLQSPFQPHFIDRVKVSLVPDAHSAFQFISAAQLNAPLSDEDFGPLSKVERQQVQYWKPKTYGALIFNSWD